MSATLAIHQLPTSCYVCGGAPRPGETRPSCEHNFTNAEAIAEADAIDARTPYAGVAEARYVRTHRPY